MNRKCLGNAGVLSYHCLDSILRSACPKRAIDDGSIASESWR
jgi:hypothetical protein